MSRKERNRGRELGVARGMKRRYIEGLGVQWFNKSSRLRLLSSAQTKLMRFV